MKNKLPAMVRPIGPLTRKLAGYVPATGCERHLAAGDVLVAKTDLAGRITYMSPSYLRLIGLSEREAIGAPHSLLRHPVMPHRVFADLWRDLEAGRERFVHLCNMTAAGDHFWALARIAPTFGLNDRIVGYHADLHCPDREEVERLQVAYAEMRRRERLRLVSSLAAE